MYKLRKGKQEQYVKDDDELNDYLINQSLAGASLYVNSASPALGRSALEGLAKEYSVVQRIQQRLQRRFDLHVLEEMLNITPLQSIDSRDALVYWSNALVVRLNQRTTDGDHYRAQIESFDKGYGVRLTRRVHGNPRDTILEPEFFSVGRV